MDRDDPMYPIYRIELAHAVQNQADDPDRFYKKNEEPTEELLAYLREHNVPIPVLPEDGRRNDIIKLMVRIWADIEALNCASELVGKRGLE